MGTVVDTQVDEGKDNEESDFRNIGASDPVEGDGRLVPATDDEVMEVEHLLEEDKSGLASDEPTRHFDGCVSNERLPSKKSDFEGLSQSENAEADSQRLNARLEYIEVMLQKVKQEERLRLSSESLNHSTKCMDVNCQTSDGCNETQACNDKLQPENTSMETAPSSMVINGSCSAQLGSAEACLGPANEVVMSRSSVSECTSSKPDFSILKREICLDNLSIRELQEAFRATFGRQTSVKDKLWLKRRIAMGLTNSCDVPTTSYVIKDNKRVHKEMKEEPSRLQKSQTEAGSLSMDPVNDLTINNSQNLPSSPTDQTEDQQVYSKRLRKPLCEDDEKNENLQMEQFAGKRVRKPTRRYIEELSEFETRECTAKLLSSVKNSGHCQSSPKSRIRPVHDIGSQGISFATRQDSLGGLGIQVPFVSRVRRGRPRKNLATLMKYHPSGIASNRVRKALRIPAMQQNTESGSRLRKARALPMYIPQRNFVDERGKRDVETINGDEEQYLRLEKFDAAGDNTDDNADSRPLLKGGVRRKHHRAWTLGEVLKLVDGVARYGAGRWSEIRRLAFASYSYRTSVDLKDKWRNLLRASLAHGPTDKGAKNSRKHASIPIPTNILSRVRELAEMHSQTGIELGPSKITGRGGRIVQEKGSGFL
ncbi:uncharacterized protein [Elaeis guineensis]|uniref:Uncharacterized protein LOC105053107 isoform X2 n=1 Tax=Elaeis guineensis var. tenera TaxID=51953 RepID=A0A6I9RTR8_ELAGV|nr:uncharacterized protein LOC105053107 isoform X2 [Elaeis guineensis]XP_029122841.1 uncharacterized protein LOC105053107 isoform X2 [Elaeis guineensis]